MHLHFCVSLHLYAYACLYVRSCLGTHVSIFMRVLSPCTLMHACINEFLCVCAHVSVCVQVTFVSDEVSAEDNEEAEQDEDDNSYHPSDHSVVHPRRGRHGCGVLRAESWYTEERRGEEKGKSCSKDKEMGVIMRERGKKRMNEKERDK